MKSETFSWLKQKLAPYRRHIVPLLGCYVSLNFKWYQFRTIVAYYFFKQNNAYVSYSVVSACFNVGDYLDFFLGSLIHQTLDFKKHIKVILVDDGSTDNTWKKILKWQQRYPLNIIALHQENAGQASARNYGLSYVKSPWVTFADPDDFYDPFSFEKVDKLIEKERNSNLAFISLNYISFYEDKKGFIEDHPLRYRFKDNTTVRKVECLGNFIQMSVNSLFIRSDIVVGHLFSNLIKPTFEDSFFVNCLFLENMEKSICFSKEARYFYRKRKNFSSTLDICWYRREQFIDVQKFGLLRLLKKSAEKFNRVPVFVQNVAIYHIQWYFRKLRNREDRIEFLSEQERDEFINLLKVCFAYIEPEIFQKYSCVGLSQDDKAELSFFLRANQVEPHNEVIPFAHISSMLSNKELRIQLLSPKIQGGGDFDVKFYINNKLISPASISYARNNFCGRTLSYWLVGWLSLEHFHPRDKLSLTVNGRVRPISINNKIFIKDVAISEIASILLSSRNNELQRNSKYARCWLVSDRDCQADDNGEHFYRYLKENKPEINAWFLLKKKSHDWKRLQDEGFKLIEYGSEEHKTALRSCWCLISSHADDYVVNSFGDRTNTKVPFIFLQHGVIKDDLSGWLNSKKIRLMLTSTVDERNSIINNQSKYQLGEREVILSGLPRHDLLLKKNNPQRLILVMPTWRNSLVGTLVGETERSFNPKFKDSEFFQMWCHFLTNPLLFELLKKYDFHLKFFLHFNFQPYLNCFSVPSYVEICSHATHSFQDIVGHASLMITDYSSAAFDMAYLKKDVIYYQFDRGKIFKNDYHTYQKGYFDYDLNGFGPIVEREEELFRCLESSLRSNCIPKNLYLQRMQMTFPFRDSKCCERVFNSISELEHIFIN